MARVYELTDKGRGMEMKNQQGLIHNAMHDGPRTVEQIAASIKATLVTRQPAEKVVAFYMSTWKKDGVVRVTNESFETTVKGTEVTTAPAEKQVITSQGVSVVTVGELGLVDTPVSDEILKLPSNERDIIQGEERAEAVSPANDRDPALQQRDGETLMSYIFRLAQDYGPIWPTDVEQLTFGAIRKKQAQDTLSKLKGAQHVAKSEDGYRAVSNNPYRG